MKILIKRFNELKKDFTSEFNVKNKNLLQSFIDIRNNQDSTLTFRCGCKSGVCGSCAVRVNGIEKLACKTNINDNDFIEPIKNNKVIKDLVVDVSHETLLIKRANLSIHEQDITIDINKDDIKLIDLQSNCILCNSCFSACPVYDINKDFLGPFALTRAFRYAKDKKISKNDLIVNSIQTNGIWDCTLCSLCTIVCPQGIDPKSDIMQLQNLSIQKGHNNPKFDSFSFNNDYNDFGGFNPNSF